MARRLLLTSALTLAMLCLAWGQQQPADPSSSSSSQQQPAADSTSQPQDQSSDKQDTDKKKDGRLKRTLKRGKPDCILTWCRSEEASAADKGQKEDSQAPPQVPKSQPIPRSDRDSEGTSSSRDTQIDLTPPANDASHPGSPASDVSEFHPWDPHRAAKDVEVGDFYFKRGNFHAAESRYREALQFKPNDAVATFRLAEALDRQHRVDEAVQSYQAYLKILPSGDYAKQAQEAIERLSQPAAEPKNSGKR